ncbi:glycosyltransferase family 4 protein [bacterium]|nr:glycosyltransferase family 4 protein [bacterium]MBT6831675.1 glycosyltransferase family 4 protein [bacterium]MBT6996321.1 glycosyltransferase family 4 protein [bacterium]MBT7772999.1 glycosyltransferase family 4 protein [bacterium]
MKPVKIGIDARMFSDAFTGIGRYNFELTRRFFSKFPDVQWVLFLNEPQFSQFDFPKNVRKICVNAPHYSLAEQTHFLKILNREKCDLVHFTHFNVPILYRGKFVVTIHDTTISFFPGKKFSSWWRKIAYRIVISNAIFRSKKVITVSKNTAADVEKLFRVSPKKITPIWNGIGNEFSPRSESEHFEIRKKFDLPEKFLLYTGVWREHKNLVGLLRAFARIKNEELKIKNLNLVITGKQDPNYPEVLETVKNLNLEKSVKFVGLVDFADLQKLYSAAAVYVFPSFYEGFGLPPLEAMAAGTPVAASNSSAIPEVCGDAALFFNPKNTEEMAAKISEILENPKLAADLVARGAERVKKFSWDFSADATLKIYREVVQF